MPRVEHILAREILDSRGQPTVEVDLWLEKGHFGCGSVPSGTSSGSHEALELRDGDLKRYAGKGVSKAVNHVNRELAERLEGRVWQQSSLDAAMAELDGTMSYSRFGANAILGVSLAFAQAAAQAEHRPLYQYFRQIGELQNELWLPTPMILVLEGGKHADRSSDMQEFMLVPHRAPNFSESLRMGTEIYHAIAKVLSEKGFGTEVGMEGAYGPELRSNSAVFEIIMTGIERAGYRPGEDVGIAIDVAASEFYEDREYHLEAEQRTLTSERLIDLYEEWIEQYPIVSIEDGLQEDDWAGWQSLTARLGGKVKIVGDDLFVTNTVRLRQGIENGVGNAIIIKPNQVGTVTETLAAIKMAESADYRSIVSHRSGETDDTSIADLAVGSGTGLCKFGAPARGERIAKYNRLLRIEEELGYKAIFAGNRPFSL